MLFRKLMRDIRNNYGAYLACSSVLVIGLTMYVAFSVIVDNLNSSLNTYYQDYNFAQGFAQVTECPPQVPGRLKSIPGIDRVEGRYTRDVLLHRTAGQDITTLRLVSFARQSQKLNLFKLVDGRVPRDGQRELLVTPAFFAANHYSLGQSIPLIVAGREVLFTITGTAISPEFVYEISAKDSMYPNPVTFGVAWVPAGTLASLPGFGKNINDISFSLKEGTTFAQIKGPVSNLLRPYGLISLVSAQDQLSNFVVQQEITSVRKMAETVPILFLTIAAAILYIVLRRMVEQQRGQIGILKAFGFSNNQIILHYLWYAWIIGLMGGLGGSLAGSWLTLPLATMYREYFNIPGFQGGLDLNYVVAGTLLTLLFTSIAGFSGCKQVLKLAPSEAMRPAAPVAVRRTPVEKIPLLWRHLHTQGKMAVRNLFRNRQRSMLALVGIACAFAMIVAFQSMLTTITYLMSFQYEKVELYDVKAGLSPLADRKQAVSDGSQLKGVSRVEPMLEIAASLEHHWLKKDLAVMGLEQGSTLYRLLDSKGISQTLPTRGLAVSTQVAKVLDLQPGDTVTITFPTQPDRHHQVQVTQIISQYLGLGVYMDIDTLSSLLGGHELASALLIKASPGEIINLRTQLQKGAKVTTIRDKTSLMEEFSKMMASYDSTMFIMQLFGLITGFAIVYNINLISLSERQRELATLMVLGMTEGEVAYILYLEQGVLGLLGMLLGIPLSYGLLSGLATAYSNDMYNMPAMLDIPSILLGVVGTLAFVVIALWKIRGKLSGLSILDVLKAQE